MTSATWFRPFWEHTICFVYRRIRFISPNGAYNSPTHSNVFVYLGDNVAEFIDQFQKFGRVVVAVPNLEHISTCTGE